MPVIAGLGKVRQENSESEANFSKSCLKTKQEKTRLNLVTIKNMKITKIKTHALI
jgi:hypothetical protein